MRGGAGLPIIIIMIRSPSRTDLELSLYQLPASRAPYRSYYTQHLQIVTFYQIF